jgi:RNase P/RNase MRP subunit POP5
MGDDVSITIDLEDFDDDEVIRYAEKIANRKGILNMPWHEETASKDDKAVAYNVLSEQALKERELGNIVRANSLELVARGLLYNDR